MREVDRRTSELGVPGLVLMENAGQRVVELLAPCIRSSARATHCRDVRQGQQWRRRIGGGAAALYAISAAWLHVVLAGDPNELEGDAAANYKMLEAVGCPVSLELTD